MIKYKTIDSTEEIQHLSFKVLSFFDSFCKENNLRYSLAAGTMLGAIRHKGFIPWDDDVDVIMPRPDYDKLLSLRTRIENGFALINFENMDIPYFAYSKLIDTNTLVIEHMSIPNSRGIDVDIFPVDGLPNNILSIKFHFGVLSFYKKLIALCTLKITRGQSLLNYLLKLLFIPPARLFLNLETIVKSLDRLARKYSFNNSKIVAAQTLNYGEREILPREAFDEYVDVEFCGKEFSAISCYDTYLRNLFGDYMILPPIEQRISSHGYEAYYLSEEG